MNLQELQNAGGFVEAAPVRLPVEWVKPAAAAAVPEVVKFDVWVRRRSFGMVARIWQGEDNRARSAEMIAASIVLGGPDGDSMSYDQAYQLDPGLAGALVDAINKASAVKN